MSLFRRKKVYGDEDKILRFAAMSETVEKGIEEELHFNANNFDIRYAQKHVRDTLTNHEFFRSLIGHLTSGISTHRSLKFGGKSQIALSSGHG